MHGSLLADEVIWSEDKVDLNLVAGTEYGYPDTWAESGASVRPYYNETNTLLRLLVSHADNGTLLSTDPNQSLTVANAAIRQDCTFFAGLCIGLLAATGAVLAKQWLVIYDRTGRTGSLGTQSLRWAEKFLGAEAWGFQPVVEFLPTLLLISLALFFVALVDFLWAVSLPIALVVLVFFAFGAFWYGLQWLPL
ncbi:hypothetical protein FRB96_009209 [Tulasnella sp. 330]|nr:hypothetical protein FRB96_009209 [Tulasnella sp. 330]